MDERMNDCVDCFNVFRYNFFISALKPGVVYLREYLQFIAGFFKGTFHTIWLNYFLKVTLSLKAQMLCCCEKKN